MKRGRAHILALGVAAAALVTSACVEQERLNVDPYERPLLALSIDPALDGGPVARNPVITVRFNTYVDPAPLTYYNVVSLRSGGHRAFGPTEYHMVDKAIVWRTTRWMLPDLYYTLGLDAEVLRTVTGQPYEGPEQVQYLSGDYSVDQPERAPAPTWEEIRPILEPCGGCHDDPDWQLPAITPEGMVHVPSTQREEVLLVRPFDPAHSYLMHKLLPDYPIREGTTQPPAWAGHDPLSVEELRAVEAWILGGARLAPPEADEEGP